MTTAQQGDTVRVHYTGTLTDQTVFDTSHGREPLEFTIGTGQLIPGFEEAIVGMEVGDTKTVHIPAEQAYGQHHTELVATVDRTQLPTELVLEVGQHYQFQQPDGQAVIVAVTDLSPSQVTFDANHPLAGQDLTFELELVDIV
jgi:peptidylprolyl isomerase